MEAHEPGPTLFLLLHCRPVPTTPPVSTLTAMPPGPASEHCPGDTDPSSPTAATTLCLMSVRDPGCTVSEACLPAEPCTQPPGLAALPDSWQRDKDAGHSLSLGQGTGVGVGTDPSSRSVCGRTACPRSCLGTAGSVWACHREWHQAVGSSLALLQPGPW